MEQQPEKIVWIQVLDNILYSICCDVVVLFWDERLKYRSSMGSIKFPPVCIWYNNMQICSSPMIHTRSKWWRSLHFFLISVWYFDVFSNTFLWCWNLSSCFHALISIFLVVWTILLLYKIFRAVCLCFWWRDSLEISLATYVNEISFLCFCI